MWQELLAAIIVALAVAYLARKVFGLGRRRAPGRKGPDVPLKRLTRKKDACH